MNYLYSHPLISFTVIILVPLLLQHHSTTALTPLPPTINAQQHNNNWTLSEQVKNYTHAPVNYKLSYIHSVLHQYKAKPKGCSCKHHRESDEHHHEEHADTINEIKKESHNQTNQMSILKKPNQQSKEQHQAHQKCKECQDHKHTDAHPNESNKIHAMDESYTNMTLPHNNQTISHSAIPHHHTFNGDQYEVMVVSK